LREEDKQVMRVSRRVAGAVWWVLMIVCRTEHKTREPKRIKESRESALTAYRYGNQRNPNPSKLFQQK
jgi:hypothetical protein